METVAMADILERATAATSSLFEHKGLALVTDVAPGLPPVVGDADRLLQVVINLLSNAVKFTSAGSVTCRARVQDDGIAVSVIDTGLGISAADQPKVFEKFKQVGDTLTDKPKGTGLGLPICREIVEHHGGRIWVESEPGKGSTFTFVLPAKLAADQAKAPVSLEVLVRQLRDQVAVQAPSASGHQPNVLAVDDDPHVRALLAQEFSEAGYRLRVAANGREALAEVRRERPDLVILDVMMPEMNGFDVAAVLKNDPQTMDIPIIILSIVEDRTRGFRLGIDRYLTKPIDTALHGSGHAARTGPVEEAGARRRRRRLGPEDALRGPEGERVQRDRGQRGRHRVQGCGGPARHHSGERGALAEAGDRQAAALREGP
jgi:CheY-like chemotaxis protein/anti-sigma regulatory factor (Ser/Thr protein kinase)